MGDDPVPFFGGAAGEAIHHLGVDYAGADGVDPDVRRGVVECGVFGQADHAVFRGGIGGAASKDLDSRAGGGVDDRAAAVLEQQRDLVLQAQEHAFEVDGDDPVPFLFGDLGGRLGLLLGAGVVEGVVQAPEPLHCLGKRGLHVRAASHVAADGEGLAAEDLDHPDRVLAALLVDVGDHDVGAFTGERQCGGAADAAGRAGHERDLAVEVSIRVGHVCSLIFGLSGSLWWVVVRDGGGP